jgi:NitT/TauT family transport system substrate-binding protein
MTGMTRRTALASGLATAAVGAFGVPAMAQQLHKARFAVALKSLTAAFANTLIAEKLGYAKARGITIEGLGLGSSPAIYAAMAKGDLEFGAIAPSVALPLFAKGEFPPIVSFYEYTYPYKWDVVVRPDSPINDYASLRGKKIGVSNFGTTDYPITRVVLKNIGIDPDKDVTWSAVGEGVTAGHALDRGVIDALAYFDTGFAIIENAEIKLRYLDRPSAVPLIGGFFIGATRDFLKEHRDICVAYGQCVAMGTEYSLANPAAAARAFLDMYPSTAARGTSPEVAVERAVNSMKRRMTLWRPPYPNAPLGSIQEEEWKREVEFLGLKVDDVKPMFTNDLIKDINNFNRDEVIAAAKAAKS